MKRRNFLQQLVIGSASLGIPISSIENLVIEDDHTWDHLLNADTDEAFWHLIRQEFTVSPNIINLNNGGVSPQPRAVQDMHIKYYRFSNEAPSYYMWRILDKGREALRENLAQLVGCEADEVAINRNSTEGLNSIIFGLDLQPGDEIVLSKYDYPNMMNAWKQRAKRDGIVLRWVDFPVPCEDKSTLIKAYTDQFSTQTKLVHLTHLINWSGQVIPVKDIADIAKSRGIEVLVDAAHSFAHLDFKISDLNCDYMATSLHKWLCAPFGSGLMYIRREKISKIWALLSADEPDGPDIRKFESLGTRSFASEMAIGKAIDFHHLIGAERKLRRLKYLRNYWLDAVKTIPKIRVYSPSQPDSYGAISVFGIDGMEAGEIDQLLFNKHQIHTVPIKYEAINGVRVTPSVYTSIRDLDKLIDAITKMAV